MWYPKESSFDLVAYSDSDYGGANLDRKSTTGGCQFIGHRLISWQCKKQTIVATSTTEDEYVAAAHCYGQVALIKGRIIVLLYSLFEIISKQKDFDNGKQLKNVSVPLDHFHVHALTSKVFSFMVKKGKHFSGRVTPLEAQVDPQPDPSPRPLPSIPTLDLNLEGSGGNHGDQAAEIKDLKDQVKRLKKQTIPYIRHHKAWIKAVKLKK
ncbi:hypothetical protein Tco_0966880 [Tanacetum coccineum]